MNIFKQKTAQQKMSRSELNVNSLISLSALMIFHFHCLDDKIYQTKKCERLPNLNCVYIFRCPKEQEIPIYSYILYMEVRSFNIHSSAIVATATANVDHS